MQVDALGFVFAESARRVSPAEARVLARPARSRATCVAVTRHPTQTLIDEILAVFRPDALQTDLEDLSDCSCRATLELLPVVRSAASTPAPLPARILFEGAASGSGALSDWQAAGAAGAAHAAGARRRPQPCQCGRGDRRRATLRRGRVERCRGALRA